MLHKAVTTGHKGQSTLLVSLSPVDNRRCMTLARQKCADRTGASFDKGGEFFFNQLSYQFSLWYINANVCIRSQCDSLVGPTIVHVHC
jgi:hypothetical protein